jgi:hypothetical protein
MQPTINFLGDFAADYLRKHSGIDFSNDKGTEYQSFLDYWDFDSTNNFKSFNPQLKFYYNQLIKNKSNINSIKELDNDLILSILEVQDFFEVLWMRGKNSENMSTQNSFRIYGAMN